MTVKPDDVYNPTPSVAPTVGAPNDYLGVRANSNQFGGQIGGALEKAGQVGQEAENKATDLAVQYQGMLNETYATDGETQAATKYGAILGKYKSMEGLDAVHALPDTVTQLQQVRQEISQSMPNIAARRAFNMLASRRESFALTEVNSYGATQIKAADSASALSAQNLAVNQASDPSVATNPQQFQDVLANLKFQTARVVTNQGYGAESGTGMQQDANGDVTFDTTTPQGKQAQEVYDDHLNKALGQAYANKYKTLLDDPTLGNAQKANADFQNEKNDIPVEARARISAMLVAPVRNNQARDDANSVFSDAEAQRLNQIDLSLKGKYSSDQLTNTFIQQESGGRGTNIGQIQPGTWKQYAKSGEDITNAKDNAAVTARILSDYSKKFDGDPERIAVAYFSGPGNVAPAGSATPWLHDIIDPSSGKTVSSYVSDIANKLPGSKGFQSQADFYSQNYDTYSQQIRQKAEARGLGPEYVDSAVSHGQQRMNEIIQTQRIQDHADTDKILNYINNPERPVTSIAGLTDSTVPQEVRDAYQRQSIYNPLGMQSLEKNLLTANSKGQALGLGTDFYNYYSKVMSGQITKPTDLAAVVGDGTKNSPLTNTGFKVLTDKLGQQMTPTGKAFGNAEQQFFKTVHDQIIQYPNDSHGEELFQKFMQNALPKIEAGKSTNKSPGSLFDPKSPDFVGDSMSLYSRSNSDVQKDHEKDMNLHIHMFGGLNNSVDSSSYKSLDDLKQAVTNKKLSRDQAIAIAKQKKLVRDNPPPVPTPH